MNAKFTLVLSLLLIAGANFSGCKNGDTKPNRIGTGKAPAALQRQPAKVGVFLIAEHPAVLEILEGFKAGATNAHVELRYDIRSANGDSSAIPDIATYFASGHHDVVLVIGVPCVQALKARTRTVPIVFAGAPDPVAANLIASYRHPGSNVTGAYFFPPTQPVVSLMKNLVKPGGRIGVPYNPGETNSVSVVAAFKRDAESAGFHVTEGSLSGSADVNQVVGRLIQRVDALYVPTDSTLQVSLPILVRRAANAHMMTFASDTSAVRRGCLLGIAGEYRDVGEVASRLAIRVLRGENPATISAETIEAPRLSINQKTARLIGVDISSIASRADYVFTEWAAR